MKCSACSGSLKPAVMLAPRGLLVCARCGGVHGTIYRGDAVALVGLDLPMLASSPAPRYFDLTVLGSAGVSRVHGWYDAAQRRVVQYG